MYSLFLGSRAIFLVVGGGGSSGEIKIVEGIRDAKNRSFVLYIAFAGKSGGGLQPPPSRPAPPPMLFIGLCSVTSNMTSYSHSYHSIKLITEVSPQGDVLSDKMVFRVVTHSFCFMLRQYY